ncbi:MAG TPA: LLM class flavin-dependent oxidoreductase [Actinomycetota bacterium]
MRFGINYIPDAPLPELLGWWREAEDFGFEWLGIPDSPILARELYVSSAAFALSTSRARFSPMVTNPISRHPSVTAGALFSLDELAPGRVALGIGSGDSAIYGVGLKGAKVSLLEEYIRAVRGLFRGEEVTWQGGRFRAEWRHWEPPVDIKVYVSCHGPKVMRMAAGVADGIVSGFGLLPENIELTRATVREGAEAAGRDPDEVEIWYHPILSLAKDEDEAFEYYGAGTHFLARFTLEGKQIPEEHREAIRRLAAEEKLSHHGRSRPWMAQLARELGVMDYVIQREGALYGSPGVIRERLERLRDLGAENFLFIPLGDDVTEIGRVFGREILPHLV